MSKAIVNRRNRTMRFAYWVLILTIATFCLTSGSMARYVETVRSSDIARVANFIFTVSDQNSNQLTKTASQSLSLFDTVDTGVKADLMDEKLIAPGTAGSFSINVDNSSEVKIQAEISLAETNAGGVPIVYQYDGLYYSAATPVDGKVGGRVIEGDLADLEDNITAEAISVDIGDEYEIPFTWEWAYDTLDTAANEKDTELGLQGTSTVELFINCRITQLNV